MIFRFFRTVTSQVLKVIYSGLWSSVSCVLLYVLFYSVGKRMCVQGASAWWIPFIWQHVKQLLWFKAPYFNFDFTGLNVNSDNILHNPKTFWCHINNDFALYCIYININISHVYGTFTRTLSPENMHWLTLKLPGYIPSSRRRFWMMLIHGENWASRPSYRGKNDSLHWKQQQFHRCGSDSRLTFIRCIYALLYLCG